MCGTGKIGVPHEWWAPAGQFPTQENFGLIQWSCIFAVVGCVRIVAKKDVDRCNPCFRDMADEFTSQAGGFRRNGQGQDDSKVLSDDS